MEEKLMQKVQETINKATESFVGQPTKESLPALTKVIEESISECFFGSRSMDIYVRDKGDGQVDITFVSKGTPYGNYLVSKLRELSIPQGGTSNGQ